MFNPTPLSLCQQIISHLCRGREERQRHTANDKRLDTSFQGEDNKKVKKRVPRLVRVFGWDGVDVGVGAVFFMTLGIKDLIVGVQLQGEDPNLK